MNNITEYLKWRGDIPLSQAPCNEVDAYILAKAAEPDFSDIIPEKGKGLSFREAFSAYFSQTEKNPDYFGRLYFPILSKALRQAAESVRFKDLMLSDYCRKYDAENAEQFSAVTVSLPNGEYGIVFRGTDDTIAGWKEDFMMAVEDPVPSQADALEYLKKAGARHKGPLFLIGHSKGGNLAIYAAAEAPKSLQKRIAAVYNFDGPGFEEAFWKEEGTLRILDRIVTYVSQESLVGTLFTNFGRMEICKSLRGGATAHEAMFWEVMGGSFIREKGFTPFSTEFARVINRMRQTMSTEEIGRLCGDFFGILTSTGAVTLTDLARQSPGQRLQILKQLNESESVKKFGKDLAELLSKDKSLLSRLLKRGLSPNEQKALSKDGVETK